MGDDNSTQTGDVSNNDDSIRTSDVTNNDYSVRTGNVTKSAVAGAHSHVKNAVQESPDVPTAQDIALARLDDVVRQLDAHAAALADYDELREQLAFIQAQLSAPRRSSRGIRVLLADLAQSVSGVSVLVQAVGGLQHAVAALTSQ
ncbi:hypothetical protein AB0H73_08860 [Streptomyces olivoreticuli]